jgi:hypothetical protein
VGLPCDRRDLESVLDPAVRADLRADVGDDAPATEGLDLGARGRRREGLELLVRPDLAAPQTNVGGAGVAAVAAAQVVPGARQVWMPEVQVLGLELPV